MHVHARCACRLADDQRVGDHAIDAIQRAGRRRARLRLRARRPGAAPCRGSARPQARARAPGARRATRRYVCSAAVNENGIGARVGHRELDRKRRTAGVTASSHANACGQIARVAGASTRRNSACAAPSSVCARRRPASHWHGSREPVHRERTLVGELRKAHGHAAADRAARLERARAGSGTAARRGRRPARHDVTCAPCRYASTRAPSAAVTTTLGTLPRPSPAFGATVQVSDSCVRFTYGVTAPTHSTIGVPKSFKAKHDGCNAAHRLPRAPRRDRLEPFRPAHRPDRPAADRARRGQRTLARRTSCGHALRSGADEPAHAGEAHLRARGLRRGWPIVDPDLVEWNYGDYEGKRTAEILHGAPGWQLFRDGCPTASRRRTPARVPTA